MRRHRAGDGPHPLDVCVGRQLSHRRKLLGLTEGTLAEALGLTVQQVRDHETGACPLPASRLHELARLLGVSVGFFFAKTSGMDSGLPDNGAARRSGSTSLDCDSGADPRPVLSEHFPDRGIMDTDDMDYALTHFPSADEVWRLVRQFSRISDADIRALAIEQIKAMAERRLIPLRRNDS